MALLRSTLLSTTGFAHAFPERDGGDAELMAALGVDEVLQASQVHAAGTVEASDVRGQEADAIVARGSGPRLGVGVRVADCVPVLVADAASGSVAAIHAGWRGIVVGVVSAGVQRLGGRRLIAAIGPCIGSCCFEVGHEVAQRIAVASGGPHVIARSVGEKAYVDLRRAIRAQLRSLGFEDACIEDVAGCTKHEAERFHSFRRDGPNSGRMLAAIANRPPEERSRQAAKPPRE